MKRHVALSVLGVLVFFIVDSHVDIVSRDGGKLLEVSGRVYDPHGWLSEKLRQWTQDCSPVRTEATDGTIAVSVLELVEQHSLPDSMGAKLLQLHVQGDWAIAEVVFPALNPSVVVLHRMNGAWKIQDDALWSGETSPWNEADFVRRYLQKKKPELPQALINCTPVGTYRNLPGAERTRT
jgi:hypothetical protein